jgi:hypothetical protein
MLIIKGGAIMPKHKIAIILLADTTTPGDMGRMANAFTTAREFAEAGDEVRFIFDGAGVKWVGELVNPEHKYHKLLAAVRDHVHGVCHYCAKAYQVADQVEKAGFPFSDEFSGHPSLRGLVERGFQIITF